ncbi:MAG: hypothetical protein RIS45_872, partial [Planctomycetota bacterium]
SIRRTGLEDVTLDDLATLKGIATAIRDGDATIEEAFPPLEAAAAPNKGAAGLKDRLRGGDDLPPEAIGGNS